MFCVVRKRVIKSINCKKSEKKCKKVKFFIDKVVPEMYIVTRRWGTGEILRPEWSAPDGVVINTTYKNR